MISDDDDDDVTISKQSAKKTKKGSKSSSKSRTRKRVFIDDSGMVARNYLYYKILIIFTDECSARECCIKMKNNYLL